MSRASFPRQEHIVLLQQKIEQWLQENHPGIEVAERGLDHYRCQYRFGLRRPQEEWREFPVHFQVADRLEAGRGEAELHRLLETFLKRSLRAKGED